MTVVDNISGMMFSIGDMIFNFLRAILVWVLLLVVLIFIFNVIIKTIMKRKRNKFVTHEQEMILNVGKRAVKEKRLRDLFLSDSGKKPLNLGKIIGFTRIQENDKSQSDIFIVKNRYKDLKFFKVNPKQHGDVVGDVVLYNWNFTLDPDTRFLIPNFRDAINVESQRMGFVKESGIDSIGSLKPVIHKAVQINPLHRIMIRLKSLIDLGDERGEYQGVRP